MQAKSKNCDAISFPKEPSYIDKKFVSVVLNYNQYSVTSIF